MKLSVLKVLITTVISPKWKNLSFFLSKVFSSLSFSLSDCFECIAQRSKMGICRTDTAHSSSHIVFHCLYEILELCAIPNTKKSLTVKRFVRLPLTAWLLYKPILQWNFSRFPAYTIFILISLLPYKTKETDINTSKYYIHFIFYKRQAYLKVGMKFSSTKTWNAELKQKALSGKDDNKLCY